MKPHTKAKVRCCPNCKRPYPSGWKDALEKRRGDSIKRALAKLEIKGRPRSVDYAEIYRLRDEMKLSIDKIAQRLGVSRGSVEHALRVRMK